MQPLGRAWDKLGYAARALLGVVLLALSLTPVFRLLDHPGTGLPGESTVSVAESNLGTAWMGAGVSLALGVVLAILIPRRALVAGIGAIGRRTGRVGLARWTVLLTILSTGLALLASLLLYKGLPTLADGMTSLLHARFLAHGHAAGAFPDPAAAWLVPNGVLTTRGWVSQYPPMHPLLLALGLRVGAPWVVGPLLTGLLVLSTSLATHHLLGRSHGARLGALLVAISPFVVLLGGGYLSHVSAAAFAALTLLAGLKARDGRWTWSVAAGTSMAVLVTSRPWVGLFLGTAFTLGIWLAAAVQQPDRHLRRLIPRLAGAALGGIPLAVLWGIYNRRYFGHPLRLGYTTNFGASHGLGFHVDPWGNVYGPLEGLGYTSADLIALGNHALETSLPLIPVVALYLILVRSIPRGAGVLLAWAVLPLAANLFYWHHGAHLGPRMLYEAAPAWLALASLAVVSVARRLQDDHVALGKRTRPRPSAPEVALWAIIASVPIMGYLVPLRIASYRWSPETVARITPPSPPGPEPALVFVHGSWPERIAARLQADGFGMDSLETGLRRSDTCTLHRWATIRLGGRAEEGVDPPRPDFESLPGVPVRFADVTVSPGNRIHVDREAPWSPDCQREADADRGGVISLAPLLWQGDLPGIDDGKPMFARDLGPRQNRALIEAFPDRRPFMFFAVRHERTPVLTPYAQGEAILWGTGDPPSAGEER